MIKKLIILFLIISSYITSILLYVRQPYNSACSFVFWITSILLIFIYLINKGKITISKTLDLKKFSIKKFLNKNRLIIFIVLMGIIIRFWNLSSIPILTHDEAKDAGLFPQKIISGEIKDYFGFHAGINNNFFVLSSIPHLLNIDQVLKVRLFSALFGTISIILIYLLTNSILNKKTALISAFLLCTYHVHIHFSRTEFLNLFDGFYALVILLAFNFSAKAWKINSAILLATILGLGLHFYSGLRAFILLTSITFITFIFIKSSFKKFVVLFITFLLFFLITLGPTISVMTTRKAEFMATGTASTIISQNQTPINNLITIASNYKNSLLAYIQTPIDFHYRYGGPFLIVPFSIFFLIGLAVTLSRIKKPVYFLIILLIFGIPLLNSAILNTINYTHRLLSLVPLIILLTAFGIEKSTHLFKIFINKKIQTLLILIICIYFAIYNINLYFRENIWEKTLNINEFRAWEAQKIINRNSNKDIITFFIGNNYYPSFKSVPPLEYLTQKHTIIDVTNQVILDKISNYKNYINYLFIIMPENNYMFDKQALIKNLSTNKIEFERIYYKDIYLFDLLSLSRSN